MTHSKDEQLKNIQLNETDSVSPSGELPSLSVSGGQGSSADAALEPAGEHKALPARAGNRGRDLCLFLATLASVASVCIWYGMAISHNPQIISGTPDVLGQKYLLFVQTMWIWFAELTMTTFSEGLQVLVGPGWPFYLLPSVLVYLWSVGFYVPHALLNKQLSSGQRLSWCLCLLAGYGLLIPLPTVAYWWKFLFKRH